MQGNRSTPAETLRRRLGLRGALLTGCLALVAIAALPATASASYPWANQTALREETNEELRATYIIDSQHGTTLTRHDFLSYLGFFQGEGFDRNFFTWAPEVSVGDEYLTGRRWTGCNSSQVPGPEGMSHCAAGAVKLGAAAHLFREDVLTGPLTGLKWGDTFISNICGNWSPADTAAKGSPMPTISGVKYEDKNANGVRDPGEPGLPGWTIQLYYNGSYVASTTTGAGGAYSFKLNADSLPIGEGKYTLKEVGKSGWHQSHHPSSIVVHYGAGDRNFSGNDFGNWQPATIAGHKFDDSNLSGTWDASELGIEGWGISLSDGAKTSTGSGGAYSFSVEPGTYTVSEAPKAGWRQTTPGGSGTFTHTVVSGQVLTGLNFGNVCLGGVSVEPVDDSTGKPLSGMAVRLEEVSVPGILANEPSLPRTATGSPDFGSLLPGTYRVVAFLPEGVFTTDPAAVVVEGRFAIVDEVAVSECHTTSLPLHTFTQSTPGKVTGGVRIARPDGFATSGFEFMTRRGQPRGTLEYQDHSTGLNLHTAAIEAVYVADEVAWVWGKFDVEGTPQRFRLRLVDAGEPGTADRYELTLATGYEAGQGETLEGGDVQIH